MKERMSVPDAASRLGISEGALRQRLHRGSVESEKGEDGRVYVVITGDDVRDNDHNTDGDNGAPDEITELLRHQNEFLRREVEAWQEEARRKDHIIAGLVQRVPELEAAQEPREAPVAPSEEADNGKTPPEQQEPTERSWWQRLFGA